MKGYSVLGKVETVLPFLACFFLERMGGYDRFVCGATLVMMSSCAMFSPNCGMRKQSNKKARKG